MCSVRGDNFAVAIKVLCPIRHRPRCLNSIPNSCWRCSTLSTWIGNWTQPPGMVGFNGTAGFSSRRMPCILLLEKPVLLVVWLQCNIGLRHSAFGVGGLAEARHLLPRNQEPATQNECHDWSASHMKRHLQCVEQQASPSSFTKYCACHAKWISWLIRIAYATSFTMREATGITLQPHQVLRLPRKMNLMIDPHHIWNVIYNAWSNRHHPPTAPNTAPATQNECHDWSCSPMKRHFHCAEQQASPSNLTKYCACHAKWISWLIRITYETSFTMRGATGITLQPHQILRLPRKMNVIIDRAHLWNVISNAQSSKSHPPTSPNTAPATQYEHHDWSRSRMKRHLQCAEVATGINLQPHQILHLPRKIAFPNLREIYWKQLKWHFQCATDPSMIREWSEHAPSMIRPRQRKTEPAAPPRLLFALDRSRFYWKLQRFPLRLSFENSPHAAPATKSDTWTSPNAAPATKSDTWTSPNAAPATKSDTWTSPNAAPATKSDTWTSPNAAPATKSHTWTSPNAAPATKSETWTAPNAAPATKLLLLLRLLLLLLLLLRLLLLLVLLLLLRLLLLLLRLRLRLLLLLLLDYYY